MDPRFLQYNLNTLAAQEAILSASGSTAQPHFYLGDIRAFPIALAPKEEQQKIISEIEHRFLIISEIEVQLYANIKHSAFLRQSILKHAFEGRLVPQDPNDEPASMLLERIKAEMAGQISMKSKRNRAHNTHQMRLNQ